MYTGARFETANSRNISQGADLRVVSLGKGGYHRLSYLVVHEGLETADALVLYPA